VERNASAGDIKKAYKEKALRWHPDKHSDGLQEEAEKRFAEASNAYEILKDPQTRQEYDATGQVGGSGAGGFGHATGQPSQADVERIFREAFGHQILQQILQQQQQQMQQGCGGGPRRRPRGVLQTGMEIRIRPDVANIHRASRASNIDMDYDERRARYAGKIGTIAKVDPRDQSIKVRVMVSPGRADEVWFGAGAVWDPSGLEQDVEVQICPEVEKIHESSRETGIDTEHDRRRARCAGKIGTVVDVDRADHSVKVRVPVLPGRADEVWFGIGAVEPAPLQQAA